MAGYIGSKTVNLSTTGADIDGNITISGNVDGRDVAALGTKLDTVEANAKDDQTAAEIRALVAAASDSNVFTDADHSKLNGLEATGDVTDATNVAAAGALMRSGGAMTGAITTNSTFDGVDIATRDAVLTATTTVANAALPKAGGAVTGNVTFGDNDKAIFGAGSDLQIYHDGSNNYIKSLNAGWLNIPITGSGISIANSDFSENLLKILNNGGVELYHNGSKKIETTSTGVTVGSGTASTYVDVTINGANTSNYGPMLQFQKAGTLLGKLTNYGSVQGGTSNDFFLTSTTTNQLIFGTNNTQRMVISGAGIVGIGTSSPATDAKLVVSNGGAQGFEVRANSSRIEHMHYNRSAGAYMPVRNNGLNYEWLLQNGAGMAMNNSGVVTKPSQPAFSVRLSLVANANYTSGPTVIAKAVTTYFANVGNHFSASTGRFTAPVSGYYVFGANLRYDGFSGSYFYLTMTMNNNMISRHLSSTHGTYLQATVQSAVLMSQNDYVDLNVQSAGDTAVLLDGDSNFFGYLVG